MGKRTEENLKKREEYFRKRLEEAHGNEYDLSKFRFINVNTKACFICHKKDKYGVEHGEFITKPYYLLQGHGCPKCGDERIGEAIKDSQETFIDKCRKTHGDKYDYSKVKYVNTRTKVCIICREHGEFWVTPSLFIRGTNCPVCGRISAHIHKTNDTQYFVNKANEIHKGKYDYSKSVYTKTRNKLIVTCQKHGDFEIKANAHLNGQGCPKCANENNGEIKKFTLEQFIERSNRVHNSIYSYSKVNYIDANTKVCIICHIHGEFWQTPSKHINSRHGCPKCNQSHLERDVMQLLDDNNIEYEYQKRFKWLGLQSLDFYLPDYNIAIECQGEQHFKPITFNGNINEKEEMYKINIIRDNRKLKLCKDNNIKILYYTNCKNIPENYMRQGCITDSNELLNIIQNN